MTPHRLRCEAIPKMTVLSAEAGTTYLRCVLLYEVGIVPVVERPNGPRLLMLFAARGGVGTLENI